MIKYWLAEAVLNRNIKKPYHPLTLVKMKSESSCVAYALEVLEITY